MTLARRFHAVGVAGMGGLAGAGKPEEQHPVMFGTPVRLLGGDYLGTGMQAEQTLFLGVPHRHPQEAHLHFAHVVYAQNDSEILFREKPALAARSQGHSGMQTS